MNQEQLDSLKKLAKKATPGPWKLYVDNKRLVIGADGRLITSSTHCMFGRKLSLLDTAKPEDNAAYISAANPQAILDLLADYEKLQKEYAELQDISSDPEILNDPQALLATYFAGRMAEGREKNKEIDKLQADYENKCAAIEEMFSFIDRVKAFLGIPKELSLEETEKEICNLNKMIVQKDKEADWLAENCNAAQEIIQRYQDKVRSHGGEIYCDEVASILTHTEWREAARNAVNKSA